MQALVRLKEQNDLSTTDLAIASEELTELRTCRPHQCSTPLMPRPYSLPHQNLLHTRPCVFIASFHVVGGLLTTGAEAHALHQQAASRTMALEAAERQIASAKDRVRSSPRAIFA